MAGLKAVVIGSLAGLSVVQGFTGPAGALPSSANRHAACSAVMAAEPMTRRAAVLTTLLGAPLLATKAADAAGLNIIPPALRDASKGGKREVEGLSLEEQYPDEPAPVPKAEARKKAREEAKKAAEAAKAAKAAPKEPAPAPAKVAKRAVVEDPVPTPTVDADDKEYKVRRQQVAGATGKEKFETSATMSLEEKLKKRAAAKLDAQYESLKQSAPVRDEKQPSLIPGK